MPSSAKILDLRGTPADAALAAYVGRYRTADGAVIVVRKDGTTLTAETPGPSVVELLPESQTTFFVPGMPVKVTFVRDTSGQVERLEILHTHTTPPKVTSAQRLPQ